MDKKPIKTVFFFRKPIPGYHSIEELFGTLIRHLPKSIEPVHHTVKKTSTGIFNRIINTLDAFFHQQDINHITGDIHYIALLLCKCKTILTVHDLEIIKRSKPLKRALLLFFWFYIPSKRVKYITVISEFTKQELNRYIHIPPGKIRVIPNCIPGSIACMPKEFNTECPTILQVGTKPNKNIPNLIEAIKNINCTLLIIGELNSELTCILQKNHIFYKNFTNVPYQKVVELYRTSDILAFVSTYEGFGLPILEAQSVGRAVITSNITSMPEVAGEGALLVDPYNVDSIRSGIKKIIDDAPLREQLIARGLENVKRFTPTAIAKEYAKLYEEIMSEQL